jgi:D-psicose/D-tagatose/L-ribulose 3-epimerase
MKFAVNALIWTPNFDASCLALLPKIRENGFDGFEVPFFEPSKVEAAEIRRALSENGLECNGCCLLPEWLSPISEDAGVRRKTRDHLRECVQVTAEMGARLMGGPIYAPVGYLPGRRRTQDEWKWAVECFQSLGDVLDSCGVTLAIEPLNRFETYFLNTAADAGRLCDEVNHPRIGVLLDTFHTNIEEKDVAVAFQDLGGRLRHIHACENDRGIPGTGHVDFPGIGRALKEIQYDGWLTIESFGFQFKELAAAAAIWRDLAPSPEAIAFDGLRYLKPAILAATAG